MNFLSALIIGFFFFLSPALAADLTMTCTDSDCTASTSDPIFYETNILPGYHISRQLTVVNSRSDTCNLVFRAVNPQVDILADKVNISVLAGSTLYYSGTISHLTSSAILSGASSGYRCGSFELMPMNATSCC